MSDPVAPGQDSPRVEDVERIRDAVLACPGVAAVSSGAFGEIASYFPGKRVSGVRSDDEHVDVHIVAHYGRPLAEVSDDIGVALAPYLHGRSLQLTVEDILLPGDVLADDEADVPNESAVPDIGTPSE